MARNVSVSTLALRARQRADKENDKLFGSTVASDEVKALLSEQYGDLHAAVAGTGLRYFEKLHSITSTGAASYSQPTDHLSTVRVDRVFSDGRRYELEEVMSQEQAYLGSNLTGEALYYALVGDQLYLYPKPPTSQAFEWLYIPQSPDLSAAADGTLVDVVTADGEAFLLWGIAVKMHAKGETDARLAMAERDAARARLVEWATNRAFCSPRRRVVARDVYEIADLDPAGWWNR